MAELTGPFCALVILLISACWGQRSDPGSGRPICVHCDRQLFCNCSSSGYSRVPMVTDLALNLDLAHNNILEVTDGDFMGHKALRALSLHSNGLAVIRPAAFDSLLSLEELNLSNNQLTTLRYSWFQKLHALQRLNVLNNPYSCLGSPPPFQKLLRLRSLQLGGPALKELRKGDLCGVAQLDELTVNGNNLQRYESGTLGDIWPLGRVTLNLHGPLMTNDTFVSDLLADVLYPETPIVFQDLHLIGNESIQHLRAVAGRRARFVTFQNVSISDEAAVEWLKMTDGVPIASLTFLDITLTGEGRWEKASWTDHTAIDDVTLRNIVVLDVFKFVSFLNLGFFLQYPRKVSAINVNIFVMPCPTSHLLKNLQYLDVSDNLLTDMTLSEMLCDGDGVLMDLRVLNVSGNALKSVKTVSHLVAKLSKLTHLDISRNGYSEMPQSCSWPSTLRFLNVSRAKLFTLTTCLPTSLQVLDLSYNNLKEFLLVLPSLRDLNLSGNKLLRLPAGRLLPNLESLSIQSNTLSMFGPSELNSYRRLQTLRAGWNKFVCSCLFVPFFQTGMKHSSELVLTDPQENYVCDSPLELQGQLVGEVQLSVDKCHHVVIVSVSCGLVLVSSVLLCVLLWRIHAIWYLRMTWAWLKAKRSSRKRRRHRATDDTEPLIAFDAFVSYSESDASWVENVLVPELEGPRNIQLGSQIPSRSRPLNLCLHKRDFLPGHWIVDNIMSAMERSRQTIFVLSENFVRSEWCRYELDFSHFWIFEGNAGGEPAILILLEPLSKDDIPKRFCTLRKLMSSTTYLEWPQDEDKVPEFWQKLDNALQGRDNDERGEERQRRHV